MTEKEYKFVCKWIVDNANRPLEEFEKEIIKKVIDEANSPEEIFLSVFALLSKNQ